MTDEWTEMLKRIQQNVDRLRKLAAEAHALNEQLESTRTRRNNPSRAYDIELDANRSSRL